MHYVNSLFFPQALTVDFRRSSATLHIILCIEISETDALGVLKQNVIYSYDLILSLVSLCDANNHKL